MLIFISNTFTMKQFLITFLFLFVMGSSFAQTKETIVIKTTIHCDHCLDCESCGNRISAAIRKTKGIHKVKINPNKNTISVTFNPEKTNPEKIKIAIAEVGFDADEVKAAPGGYAKLDGCCKAE